MTGPDYLTVEALVNQLLAAWDGSTSATPDLWSTENPALGQCAVTALIVQDEFGGTMRRCMVGKASHYFNLLPDGTALDLTCSQFDVDARFGASEERTREYVLGFPDTVTRYERLKQRLSE